MDKRKIIFGTYDTAAHGWTLAGWALSPAEQKTSYVSKPNGDGSWDLSTALTDGILRYNDRELTVTLELSEGTRMEREAVIRAMINDLDGEKVSIRLPDDDHHHVVGRLHVVREYNDLAHGAVTVTATCEPWKYADAETVVELEATATTQHATLHNSGKRALLPLITVAGGPVRLTFGQPTRPVTINDSEETVLTPAPTVELKDGKDQRWADLLLTRGAHALAYSGAGTIRITYREAVLE